MKGLLYKIDKNGERLTNNITAYVTNYSNIIYVESEELQHLEIKKGDLVYYSDNDIEINSTYEVVLCVSKTKISVRKIR